MAGIYIHIPFCKQACTYCNFHFSTSTKGKDELLAAMLKEIELQKDFLREAKIETIYFGGGTPSLLTADEINRITDVILKYYPVEQLKEFTLEANPDDLNSAYLKSLRGTLINRFSIGVQSFRDEDLAYMHRAHNAQEADYAIKAAQDAGFSNLTIDLIYGTPGLTNKAWKENLSKVKELGIPHLSSYALTVEEGTALDHQIKKKKTTPVDAEQSADQFEILMEQAAVMGFEHYEISNLSLPGHNAVHNTNYWKGVPYLGLGPSAHSFDGSERRSNIANNAIYTTALLSKSELLFETEHLTPVQRLNEYIMTSIRTIWGCDLDKIAREYGSDYADKIERQIEGFRADKWVELNERKVVLTNKGKLFADRVAGELFF